MELLTTTYIHPMQPYVTRVANMVWAKAQHMIPEMLPCQPSLIPMLIGMPHLINPYCRNPGHYDPSTNIIVAHMEYHRSLKSETKWRQLIIHELTHWLQLQLNNYKSTRDTHTHISWSTACWVVGEAVTNTQFKKELNFYRSLKSVRVNGIIEKQQRQGSLTLVQLHHFPDCIPLDLLPEHDANDTAVT